MLHYTHFIARGRDVVFPKDTAMQIGLGVHDAMPPTPAQQPEPSRPGN